MNLLIVFKDSIIVELYYSIICVQRPQLRVSNEHLLVVFYMMLSFNWRCDEYSIWSVFLINCDWYLFNQSLISSFIWCPVLTVTDTYVKDFCCDDILICVRKSDFRVSVEFMVFTFIFWSRKIHSDSETLIYVIVTQWIGAAAAALFRLHILSGGKKVSYCDLYGGDGSC